MKQMISKQIKLVSVHVPAAIAELITDGGIGGAGLNARDDGTEGRAVHVVALWMKDR